MKKVIFFIFLVVLIVLFLFSFLFSKKIVFMSGGNFSNSDDLSFLLLGKPGPGYIGSENTDSIVIAYYKAKNNTLYLITIPRDLIVYNEKGELEKINALYGKRKINLLLKKASEYSGISIKNYIAIDLTLIKKLVDKLGGLEIYLDEPVTDAVTLYTIPPGKHKLNGDLIELVLRSRYHPTGDFFRMKNQMIVLNALKEKVLNLNTQEKIELIKFAEKNRYHWESNLDKTELLKISLKIKNLSNLKIKPIIITTNSGLLTSGYFNIYNSYNVYGIFPKSGIDNYTGIRTYLKSILQE